VTIAGLLLAAGGGRRFGGPKALIEHDGELLVERGVRLLVGGGCSPVVAVIGAAAEEVGRRARLEHATVVVNSGWGEGIGSSLRAGLQHLDTVPAVGSVVVALCDMPLVGPDVIDRLVAAWRNGSPAAVAAYDGEPRNPVLIDRSLWADVTRAARGDVGARGFLRAHPELVTTVECADVASAVDIDTPDDLALLSIATERGTACN
jgi:CTP:molybdopterin cytidylyltransferase MocA